MDIDSRRAALMASMYGCAATLAACGVVGWRRDRRVSGLLLAAAGLLMVWLVPRWAGVSHSKVFDRLGGAGRWAHTVWNTAVVGLLLAAVLVGRPRPAVAEDD